MISLLLLPLLLLPSIQGQTCDMAEVEERMARMEEKMEEKVVEVVGQVEEKMRKKEEEMGAKLIAVEAKEAVLKKELKEVKGELEKKEAVLRKEMETKEAVLRKELASKEEVGMAVTQGLRDLPYLTLCVYQDHWASPDSTITYDSFLTDFNNGERPGGADGQLDLGTGVFTCLSAGIYSVTFSGTAWLNPAERVDVWLYLNGVLVPESYWAAYTTSGTIGNPLGVPGSRSLVSVLLSVPPRLTSLLQMLPLQLGDSSGLTPAQAPSTSSSSASNCQSGSGGQSLVSQLDAEGDVVEGA